MKINETIAQNKNSWDAIADDWFGTTALPTYYSEVKARKIPLSFIIKARKIGEKND